ncbi:MAG TPA: hypothetical protein VN672_06315 [Solirubrobacteraceae bacterium]|nr:hypothetical protein [Solirubrobacteraceae bacterium]
MTTFFVGGLGRGGPPAEEAYGDLRELSRDLAGCPARLRRIFKLRCRLDGRDQEIEVGKGVPRGEGVVAAILDHGRHEAFIVHTAAATGGIGATLRVRNPVYGVTEFSSRGD